MRTFVADHRIHTVILVAAAVALFTEATNAAAPPTNQQLIAAMPPGTESVLVCQVEPLLSDKSVLKDACAKFVQTPTALAGFVPENTLGRIVLSGLPACEPVAVAIGGAKFEVPNSEQPGPFDYRAVWVCRKPIAPLEKQIEELGGTARIGTLDVDDITVYICTANEMAEQDDAKNSRALRRLPVLVAFPTPHTVVIAQARSAIDHMVRAVRSERAEMTEGQKSVLLGLPLDAPLVLVRKYDPTNERDAASPVNRWRPKALWADIESVALAFPDPAENAFKIRCLSPNPDRAVTFYRSAEMLFNVLPETEFEWQTTTAHQSFSADLKVREEAAERVDMANVITNLFGINTRR
ncbi:MAG: hypothetical protein JXO22_01755 [Phycisphaerae bacterium]|nr:hypothetical protein [Phycisphaerae bacterium]